MVPSHANVAEVVTTLSVLTESVPGQVIRFPRDPEPGGSACQALRAGLLLLGAMDASRGIEPSVQTPRRKLRGFHGLH